MVGTPATRAARSLIRSWRRAWRRNADRFAAAMRIDCAGHQDRVAGPTPRGATTTRKRSSMVGQRSPSHAFTRLLVAIAVVAVAALLVATLWTGRPPRVEIRPGLPGIGRRTPIQVKLDDTGRVEK